MLVAGRPLRAVVVPRGSVAGWTVASAGPIAVARAAAIAATVAIVRAVALPARTVGVRPVAAILPRRVSLGPLANRPRLRAVRLIAITRRAIIRAVTLPARAVPVGRVVTLPAGAVPVRRAVTLPARTVASGGSVTVAPRAVAAVSIGVPAPTRRPVRVAPGPSGGRLVCVSTGPVTAGWRRAVRLIPVTARSPAVGAVSVGPRPGAVRRVHIVGRTLVVAAIHAGALTTPRGPVAGRPITVLARSIAAEAIRARTTAAGPTFTGIAPFPGIAMRTAGGRSLAIGALS